MALLRTIEKNVRRMAGSLESDCKMIMQAIRCIERIEIKTEALVEKMSELNERVSVLETKNLRRCGKRTHRNANSGRAALAKAKPQKNVYVGSSSGHAK